MSENPLPHNPLQQLSIGNVVNVSLQIYRSRLRLYFKLALAAHLWLLVPLYGWAKFYAISAVISHLSFCDLIGQPESVSSASRHINRRLLLSFITGILVLLITFLGMLLSALLFTIIIFLLSIAIIGIGVKVFLVQGNALESLADWLFIVISILFSLIIPLGALWFYSRLFITDLQLTHEKTSLLTPIKQSWKLTKGFIAHLQGIIAISFLISLPILIITWISCPFLFELIFPRILPPELWSDSLVASLVAYLFLILVSLVSGVITMPFWQAIKAVAYYDIRCRRESFDLKLRDSLSR